MRVKMTEEEKKEKRRAASAKYTAKNKDKIAERRSKNREKSRMRDNLRYAKNKEKAKAYYAENREKIITQQAAYRDKNKEKIRAYYYAGDRCYSKAYCAKNKESIKLRRQKHYQANRERIIIASKNKRLTGRAKLFFERYGDRDPKTHSEILRLSCKMRTRICGAIKKQCGQKAFGSIELLGCSIAHARQHLESQFLPGMTWENHGLDGWHIDHKKPCASFDLTDPEQQKACFHYTNLQPLWATDNLSKGKKIDWQPQRQSAQP